MAGELVCVARVVEDLVGSPDRVFFYADFPGNFPDMWSSDVYIGIMLMSRAPYCV